MIVLMICIRFVLSFVSRYFVFSFFPVSLSLPATQWSKNIVLSISFSFLMLCVSSFSLFACRMSQAKIPIHIYPLLTVCRYNTNSISFFLLSLSVGLFSSRFFSFLAATRFCCSKTSLLSSPESSIESRTSSLFIGKLSVCPSGSEKLEYLKRN